MAKINFLSNMLLLQVEDGETVSKGENGDILMAGESSQGDSQGHWVDDAIGGGCEGAVGGDSGGGSSDGGGSDRGGGGSGSDEPPQLSSSPNVRAVPPRGSLQLPSATQLFVLRPVNVQAQNLPSPNGEPLEDKGESLRLFHSCNFHLNSEELVWCLLTVIIIYIFIIQC